MSTETYRTGIGYSDADSIMLLGHDLAADPLGTISFGELADRLIAGRRSRTRWMPAPLTSRRVASLLARCAIGLTGAMGGGRAAT